MKKEQKNTYIIRASISAWCYIWLL